MKKQVKILIASLTIIILLGSLITYLVINFNKKEYIVTEESLKFQKEYQDLNGKTNDNKKEYLKVELAENAPIIYTTYEEIFKILENGTGVIYFGFPECPWCRNLIPVLTTSAMEYKLDKIYYLNNREDRNTLSLTKKGKVKTDKEGSKEYLKLVDLLKEYLPAYKGLNDDSIKRLYFPTVLFVKDGKIIGIQESLESYSKRVDGDPYKPMTKEEQQELTNIFKDYYQKLETK